MPRRWFQNVLDFMNPLMPHVAEPFTPKVLFCGNEDSGKSVIFNHFAINSPIFIGDWAAEEEKLAFPFGRSPSRSKKHLSSDPTSSSPKQLRQKLLNRRFSRSSSSSGGPSEVDQGEPIQPVGVYEPTGEPISGAHVQFNHVHATMVNVPDQARYDVEFLKAQKGTVCYVLSLDCLDQEDKLEHEIEVIRRLIEQLNLNSSEHFMVLFNNMEAFQEQLRDGIPLSIPGVRFPDFQAPPNAAPSELCRLALDYLRRRITSVDTASNGVVIFCSNHQSDTEQWTRSIGTMMPSLYLVGELNMAGFLSC